jgi:hypothetical protein
MAPQPRDDRGRWASGGPSGRADKQWRTHGAPKKPKKERAKKDGPARRAAQRAGESADKAAMGLARRLVKKLVRKAGKEPLI